MNTMLKKGMALALCAAMGAGMLTGCGKKTEAAMVTFEGEAVDNDLVTFLFRYQEAAFDESYGSMFSQYYGSANVWDMDLTGAGETYGETFKTQFKDNLERMLVAEQHASDYDIALSDEDEQAISDAADKFISDNDAVTLEKMSATKEVIVRALELETIMSRVESEVAGTADTEVSYEEAAQRAVSYICYTPTTETETEAGTEADTEAEESEAAAEQIEEVSSEAGDKETSALSQTESEITPLAAESETAVETESAAKTKSSDDASSEAEAAAESSETEAAGTEAEVQTEASSEVQSETEDAATAAARVKYKAMAEAELKKIQDSTEDFSDIMTEISDQNIAGVTTSTITFGKDDSYPDAAIIEATDDLADDTLVGHVVEANEDYYILHVDKALDEDATASKKDEIIQERKQTAIDDQYTEWEKDVTFETDADAFAALEYDRVYNAPETTATETAVTEADLASGTEAGALIAETEQEPGTEAESSESAAETEGASDTEA